MSTKIKVYYISELFKQLTSERYEIIGKWHERNHFM